MSATTIRPARGAAFSLVGARRAWLAASLCAGSSSVTGCTTHNCDPTTVQVSPANSPVPFGDGLSRWQSSPDDGPWLDFKGARTFVVTYPPSFAPVSMPDCYISADANEPQASFTHCGGATAIFSDASATGVTVFNPSCAEFGLQVFVIGVMTDADAGADSGGAQSSDASGEE